MHKVVKELARDKAQLSKKINDLEDKGMITRRPLEDDARVSMISLTTTGKAYADLLRQWFSEVLTHIFAPLEAREQNELFRILKKIHENNTY